MAKKTRPTFSAPRAKAAPQATGSQWVYRSDPAPVAAAPTIAMAAPAPPAVATTPRHSSVVVNCAALLLFPVALVNGLIVEPLTACCRRKT